MQTTTISHTTWDCHFHIVFCPKYRKKIIYGNMRKQLGEILNKLLQEMKIEKLEGHLMTDHVHLLLRIPPSIKVSDVVGSLKGKSAIRLHNRYSKNKNHLHQKHFWSRGYFVRTAGLDLNMIQDYIQNQEKQDKHEDGNQLDFNL